MTIFKSCIVSVCLLSVHSLSFADITIGAVGDVMLGNRLTGVTSMPVGFLDDVKGTLEGVDIAFANLEGPIGGNNRKSCFSENCHTFSQILDAADILKATGFNLINIANNHAYDMGEPGQENTEASLTNAGLNYAGSFKNRSVTFPYKNKKIGMLSFSANNGLSDYRDRDDLVKSIITLKTQVDFLIVSMHAGCEGSSWIKPPVGDEYCFGENRGNIDFSTKLAIDSGADLVLGHGPHVPRGIITYRNKLIAWSLGNFATAQGISVKGINGYAPFLKIVYDDNFKLKTYEVLSFIQELNTGPKLDPEGRAAHIIKQNTPSLTTD